MTEKNLNDHTDGVGLFLFGFILSATALYFFFDSVRVDTRGYGLISGAMGGRGRGGGGGGGMGGGFGQTTSMGIVFLPFFISLIALFYDYTMKWAKYLLYIGIAIIVIEILSRIQFILSMKVSHLLLMFVAFAAGAGMMLRANRQTQLEESQAAAKLSAAENAAKDAIAEDEESK